MAFVKPTWGELLEAPPNMTPNDLVRLPDDGYQYELFEGILVRQVTFVGHGDLCQRLGFELGLYARKTGFANRILQNVLFDFTPPGASKPTSLAPDIAILRPTTPAPWDAMPPDPPLVAVEVVSESQTLDELRDKARVYRQAGVEEVWVIDHHTRVAEVWNAQGQITLTDTQTLTSALLSGFSLSVRYLLDG